MSEPAPMPVPAGEPTPAEPQGVIEFPCPACFNTNRVVAQLAGSTMRCKVCNQSVTVPAATPAAAPSPAPTPSPDPVAPTAAKATASSAAPRHKGSWFGWVTGAHRSGEQLIVYHHSSLFYWWPVWLLGFFFAGWTYFADRHLAIVPAGTVAVEQREVVVDEAGTREVRDVLILPKGAKLVRHKDREGNVEIFQPTIYVTQHRTLGTIYVITLLIVIAITNISVRGLWSILVIVTVLMLTILLGVLGWWEHIFRGLGQLSIFINMGGYFLISLVLCALWIVNFAIFDRQTYMVFTPGQVRVRLEIGGGETVYDTTGMVVQRQRNDLFRHWVLGFGSGDLIVRPQGFSYALDLPNVLFVSGVVRQIDAMIAEKVIVSGASSR